MWARLLSAALGIWLMAAPAVLGYSGAPATNDRIVGPLVASVALIAIWEVMRPLRRLNTLLGLWLLLAPWLLGSPALVILNHMLTGATLLGLSLIRGKLSSRFGGGWSALWHDRPAE